jgi:hypothetical protein
LLKNQFYLKFSAISRAKVLFNGKFWLNIWGMGKKGLDEYIPTLKEKRLISYKA